MDASDLKQFFETNYSQIYFIFYENFITLENSLKLKGKHFYKRNFFICKFFFFNIQKALKVVCVMSPKLYAIKLSFLPD